ncbi:MAG: efflux RND transporter periplasmic adaptor subunit [Azonexus sp.]|jgi:RND family efflux transporter MFP subunit|nr:efflux RND transporter periplasmic adaptor subunit [Azonexus sp.]
MLPKFFLRRLADAAPFFLVALLLAGCTEPKDAAVAPPVRAALTVRLIAPEAVEWPDVLAANGNIVAWQEAVIGAEVANDRIAEVRVEVGDRVRRGEVLARIASDAIASELAAAAAAVTEMAAAEAEAAGNAERSRKLRAEGFYSVQLDAQYQSAAHVAAARLAAARARQQAARLRLDKTEVRAPDDGVISARQATVGSLPQPGEELFRLIRGGRLEWRAAAPAADLSRVPVGALARLTLPDGTSVSGTVRAVAPSVDRETRTGLIYVDLPAAGAARAGMFARGQFELGQKPALALPQTAVTLDEGFAYVFRLADDHRVARVKVELGRRQGHQVEILSGLTAADKVVESGGGFLADGDVVRVVTDAAAAGKPP